MDLHLGLQIFDSAVSVAILGALIRFHREWTEVRLKVGTLWDEHTARENARIQAEAMNGKRTAHATAGS